MKQGFIVYDAEGAERNAAFIGWLTEALEKYGAKARLVLTQKTDLSELIREEPDFVIMRAMRPDWSEAFEMEGIRVFNPASVSRICNHKGKTYNFMKIVGVPILKTWNSLNRWKAEPGVFPAVVKPAMGHGGIGVAKVSNEEELEAAVEQMAGYPGGDYVIQEMASEPGKDLRVYIMGDRIVAAMLRSSDKDFRSNFCLGGGAARYEMSGEEETQVRHIMELLPFDYVGIDFLFHEGGLVFNEIEDAVGARMLYTYTDIDIADEYAAYICRHMDYDRQLRTVVVKEKEGEHYHGENSELHS